MDLISHRHDTDHSRDTRSRQWLQSAGRAFLIWALLAAPLAAISYAAGFAPAGVTEFGDAVMAALIGDADMNTLPSLVRGELMAPATVEGARIIIPSVGIDAPIVTPASADLDLLNDALARGAVRYPGSALPGADGNVFVFGHSTGLAVVHNPAFRTFNRLGAVEPGDVIRIRSGTREYWYRARSRSLVRADAAVVDLRASPGKRLLTLSTCNVFGRKEERFVIEAEFVKSYTLRGYMLN